MKFWPALTLLILSGCATAPARLDARLAGDPIACAYRVGQSIPPGPDRKGTLDVVALEATTCDPVPHTPAVYRAHDVDDRLPVTSTIEAARVALAGGDTALAADRALRAWDQAKARSTRENRIWVRQLMLDLLIECRHFDDVLAGCRRIERTRARADWFDPTSARRRVAYTAARVGDGATVERAIAEADTGRAWVLTGAVAGYASVGALERAAGPMAEIPRGDSTALAEAHRDLVLPMARAGRWTEALAALAMAAPSPCRGLLRLDLLSLASERGPRAMADLLVDRIVAEGPSDPQYVDCGAGGHWSATTTDRIRRLVRTGHLAAADSLTRAPGVDRQDGWPRAHGLALLALGQWARGDSAAATAAWLRARAVAEHAEGDISEHARLWAMFADTLLAGGWSGRAEEALRQGLLDARRCEAGNPRASALADLARRTALLGDAGSAALLQEAMAEARGIARASEQARALSVIGAAYRDTGIPVNAEGRLWLAEIVAQRPRWTPTLSE